MKGLKILLLFEKPWFKFLNGLNIWLSLFDDCWLFWLLLLLDEEFIKEVIFVEVIFESLKGL